jgi:hypothetical protein
MGVPVGGAVVDVGDIAAAQAASNLRPACRLLQVGAGTSCADNTNTTLTWDTEDYDYGGLHAAGSANVVITRAGIWEFRLKVFFPAAADYLTIGCVVAKNGANQPPWDRLGPNNTSAQRTTGTTTEFLCAVGDIITAVGLQDNSAGTARTTVFGSSFECVFEAKFIRDA